MKSNRVSTTTIIIGAAIILLFCAFVALLAGQREHVPSYDAVRKEQRLKNLAELNGENEKILTQYHWVDKAKGIVGIPIDRAMNLVLTELQSIRPRPAGPIATPLPAASPVPTPGGMASPGTNTGAGEGKTL
jgi:hypothetical protein